MKISIGKRFYLFLIAVSAILTSINAQDPFMVHFHNNRSWYNPAFTGIKGSSVFSAKYKTQWNNSKITPFKTNYFSYEESLACQKIFDYGLHVLQDEEGAGMLTTWMAGAKLSSSFLLLNNSYQTMTARFGLTMQWGEKRINFRHLSFADQLNAKYGLFDAFDNPNPTTFIIPESLGVSKTYFAPAIGFLLQYVKEPNKNRKPTYYTLGGSVHNILDLLGKRSFGNEESLLGIGTTITSRIALHGAIEYYPFNQNGDIISIKPQLFYQHQENMQYLETGLRAGWNNTLGLNLFYHSSRWKTPDRVNTDWLSFSVEIGGILNESERGAGRLDLDLSYSIGISGLKNSVGPIWEIGLAYHFSYSPMCSLSPNGRFDLRKGKNKHLCPRITRSQRKLYENIWYKN